MSFFKGIKEYFGDSGDEDELSEEQFEENDSESGSTKTSRLTRSKTVSTRETPEKPAATQKTPEKPAATQETPKKPVATRGMPKKPAVYQSCWVVEHRTFRSWVANSMQVQICMYGMLA